MSTDGADPGDRVDELVELPPAERRARVSEFPALLDAETADVRRRAAAAVADLASAHPNAVTELVDALVQRLDDDPAVVCPTAHALGELGRESPAATFGAIRPLCGLLDNPDPGVRAGGAYALGAMAASPDAVDEAAAGSLFAELQADSPAVRQHAAFLLAVVAAENPETLRPRLRAVAGGIADSDPTVRRNLTSALERLDAAFPDRVGAVRREVADALAGTDSADIDTAAFRGLATDNTAPAPLRQAARDALTAGPAVETTEHDSPAETPADATTGPDGNRTCPECGEQFGPDATFCAACGSSLE